jgi:hypothetical protein
VVLCVAGAAGAYIVLTSPRLRRVAALAARIWLGASLPIYLLNQVRREWAESARSI